ncbi:MAG: hypothetical protein HC824_02545 [Synechococcales cyanobacterium RM1_1_8]|nr:hypothetical protein [Synechococcales cyanobacterium RM1_1_8]
METATQCDSLGVELWRSRWPELLLQLKDSVQAPSIQAFEPWVEPAMERSLQQQPAESLTQAFPSPLSSLEALASLSELLGSQGIGEAQTAQTTQTPLVELSMTMPCSTTSRPGWPSN